ncbi:MAG: MFS transporter, partial [Deferrisomatales bacterium]
MFEHATRRLDGYRNEIALGEQRVRTNRTHPDVPVAGAEARRGGRGERFVGEVVGGRGPGRLEPRGRGRGRGLAPIPTLYAANLLFLAAYGAYLLLPVYLTGLGASESQVGSVLSATGIANALTLGWMYRGGERRGPCRLMVAGCGAFGLGSLVILASPSLWAVALGRMLHGVGFPLYFVAANAWLAQACPPAERAKQIGFLGIVTLVTQSVAPAASEALVAVAGWPALFAATLGLTAGSAAVLRRLPEPAPGAGGPAPAAA